MLQPQQFGGKQAVPDFSDYFLLSDWRCWSLKSAALVSWSEIKKCKRHCSRWRSKGLKWDFKPHRIWLLKVSAGIYSPHCVSLFIISLIESLIFQSDPCTVWQVSQLTIFSKKLNASSNCSCHKSHCHGKFPSNKPQKKEKKKPQVLSAFINTSIVVSPVLNGAH